MDYALFLGCTVPVRAINYELATRRVAKQLEIDLIDIDDFGCCGFPLKSLNWEAALLLAARNLSLAEERGLDISTLCNACTATLREADQKLQEDEMLRERVNKKLKVIGQRYQGGRVKIKHFVRILYEDIGLKKLKEGITKDLSSLNLTAFSGCHYLKPQEVHDHFENFENPKTLDELIKITGAKSLFYEDKNRCCGGAILGIDEKTALQMTKQTLDRVKDAIADGIISICPFCSAMFEGNQKRIEKQFGAKYELPVLYYPQILGLALGIPAQGLGFDLNRIKPRRLLERLG